MKVEGSGMIEFVKEFVNIGAKYDKCVNVKDMLPTEKTVSINASTLRYKLIPLMIVELNTIKHFAATTDFWDDYRKIGYIFVRR